jgi:thymidylate kinase
MRKSAMNKYPIYLTGADGSGKTTYLEELDKELKRRGVKSRHVWIRSPKIFSKPLMLVCRIVGLTTYRTIDGIRYGKHEFHKSKLVSSIFPLLQLIDFKIQWYFAKRKISFSETILFDRFSLDTLADIMVDTKNYKLHKTWIGKSFLNHIPKNSKVLVLYVEESNIRQRKKDTLYDEHLANKIKVYKLLSKDLKLPVIDNNRSPKLVQEEIFNIVFYEGD